jgi:hypothetical protein
MQHTRDLINKENLPYLYCLTATVFSDLLYHLTTWYGLVRYLIGPIKARKWTKRVNGISTMNTNALKMCIFVRIGNVAMYST